MFPAKTHSQHQSAWGTIHGLNTTMAGALLKLKRWQEGAAALKKAVLQDPMVNEYFVTLVNLYLNFRPNDQARILAEDVLEIVPDHATARELLQMMK
jgi:hypothetical protein